MIVDIHPGTHRHFTYRMGCTAYARLLTWAGEGCQICRRGAKRLLIDHDHDLGIWAVRGLLCPSCNVMLGRSPGFKYQPRVLAYLANPFHRLLYETD